MKKKGLYFVLTICLAACAIQKPIDLNHRVYSTGHMGMPGEYKFVFSDDSIFYYSRSVPGIYSEGYYRWIGNDSIRFISKQISTNSHKKRDDVFNSISGKAAKLKGKKLYFDGFTYFLEVR
ncbi:hypothetical protein ACFQRK_22910 [Parapedobacter sp. GCM10030251]|uniref:hypothetical protein n=1 Tax=Parapedobacter sp. GCM10030251 TaxID=3273419 RepID=UPI003608BDA9